MFLVPVGAGCLGEHVGTLDFAGGAATGELRHVPRRRVRLVVGMLVVWLPSPETPPPASSVVPAPIRVGSPVSVSMTHGTG